MTENTTTPRSTDKSVGALYSKSPRTVRDWRAANCSLGKDFELPAPSKPAVWTDEGLHKAECAWGDLKALRIYGLCPNPKHVKVYEAIDKSRTGTMEIPRFWWHRVKPGMSRMFYGYRTETERVYQFVN